ncbi:MAG: alpha/beta hydrolase [Clostridia bacterium]|nr:alpha/beta hydrolase [Clostridia bacterium]
MFKQEVVEYQFYKTANANQTILFLHGWGGNMHSFDTCLSLLKPKFNLLTLTMPTIEKTNEVWCLLDYVNLVNSLLKLLNVDKFSVVCHSFGFRVACLLNKHDIQKIVVTGGAGPKKQSILKRVKADNNKLLLKVNKIQYSSVASKDYLCLDANNKQTFKNIVNCNLKNFVTFPCPVLLFWGKRDTETPMWICRHIFKHNKATKIVTNSNHFAYIKETALFNNALTKFFNET